MSEYMTFVAKKGGVLTPICSYGRSHNIFQLFKWMAPYHKLSVVTYDTIRRAKEANKNCIEGFKVALEEMEKGQRALSSWNNTISEKIEAYAGYNEQIADIKSEIEFAKKCAGMLDMMQLMVEELEFIDSGALYVGIELPENLTIELL